jgi:hypothetical protein
MTINSIPEVIVFAAIDRATRHRDRPAVPVWDVFAHMGIPRRSRRARKQLEELVQAGLVERSRAYGIDQFALSTRGRRRLRQADAVQLPEAPQHLEWRNARTLAAQEIDRFSGSLREVLSEASSLLDGSAASDAWFQMAERLRDAAWLVGSATYCLREWMEPSDEMADIDDRREPADECLTITELESIRSLRVGRRNTRLWGG